MSAAILDRFLRTAKVLYEDVRNKAEAGKKGIDEFLFNTDDFSTSAEFTLDQFIKNPHSIVFRTPDEESHIRPFTPGVGQVYSIPRASEKTAISEQLRDSVVAGIEATANFNDHNVKMIEKIIENHVVGHTIARWKLALDTIRTGIFAPTGIGGVDLNLAIDYGRAGSQTVAYDFTAAGANIDAALKTIYDAGSLQGMQKGNRVIILGSDWLTEFETEDDTRLKAMANTSNVLLEQNMMPPELQNTQGLYLVGRYRIPGCVGPVWLTAYEPEIGFVGTAGAAPEDFMPADEAVMISLNSPRYSVFRGVDFYGAGGSVQRDVGEIIFDTYTQSDPIAEVFRGQTRYAFIPGDINKTVRGIGTFPAVS